MKPRNGEISIYHGLHLPVLEIRDNEEEVILFCEEKECQLPNFKKSEIGKDYFYLVIDKNQLQESYSVKTYGLYKGNDVEVFSTNEEGKVQIASGVAGIKEKLELDGDSRWAFKIIYPNELEKIWEIRGESKYGNYPIGLEKEKIMFSK
jgi:hypothetical protein